ncbi:hypothetical protein E2562_032622 [Oryza meyeriana var. granulata]|uniref:Uncharacterized protein n=1 Tax=Oryza meyeriana var. granulata TaxID=110450 RepID=A0A6G1DAQ2_9ORYZ|nr:hypothetical protein E2562_032622 [Oryza meyeriana var. granulata]
MGRAGAAWVTRHEVRPCRRNSQRGAWVWCGRVGRRPAGGCDAKLRGGISSSGCCLVWSHWVSWRRLRVKVMRTSTVTRCGSGGLLSSCAARCGGGALGERRHAMVFDGGEAQ